ncbi:hypothetical protein MMC20_003498 [Loxospora ochrophaea]|nr:hypothetical protein [Loxospora ochrophaea]
MRPWAHLNFLQILRDLELARRRGEIAQQERQNFGRQAGARTGNGNNGQQRANGSQISSPTISSPTTPGVPNSPSPTAGMAPNSTFSSEPQPGPEPTRLFFQERYASKLGVRGNFLPLAAKPENVDLGEWLAHQTVENYRLAEKLLDVVKEVDQKTGQPICNSTTCPVMSAGRSHTYTWLNHDKVPVKVPAYQYISMVQKWIVGKIHDPKAFPTDTPSTSASTFASGGLDTPHANTPIPAGPTTIDAPLSALSGSDWIGKNSGFPKTFIDDLKNIFRQMFRFYAHLYHSHFTEPFYHLPTGMADLNSSFLHFMSVAKLFGLLNDKDTVPMQPLIDYWIASSFIPAEAARGDCSVTPAQQ